MSFEEHVVEWLRVDLNSGSCGGSLVQLLAALSSCPVAKDIKPQLKLFPLTSEQFSIPPPCYVWRWFSTDRALDMDIRPNHSQLARRRLCQPLWRLWETLRRAMLVWVKTTAMCQQLSLWNKNPCIISSWCWPTFHNYIKVVDGLSSRVFGCAHVFAPVPLFHSRYGQQLSKVVEFCLWRQLVSHFHPSYLWGGTTTWNNDIYEPWWQINMITEHTQW